MKTKRHFRIDATEDDDFIVQEPALHFQALEFCQKFSFLFNFCKLICLQYNAAIPLLLQFSNVVDFPLQSADLNKKFQTNFKAKRNFVVQAFNKQSKPFSRGLIKLLLVQLGPNLKHLCSILKNFQNDYNETTESITHSTNKH